MQAACDSHDVTMCPDLPWNVCAPITEAPLAAAHHTAVYSLGVPRFSHKIMLIRLKRMLCCVADAMQW
jgi:hypothetical protein